MAEVLVAAAELPMGQTIKPADLRWQSWPKTAASDSSLQRASAPTALEDTVGSIVRSPFLSGEPIRREKLIKANGSGFLSAILPSGKRAVAISIDARGSNTAGGFILPNDRVDVLRTARDEDASRSGIGDVQTAATILTNIRVLAVGQTVQERNGERVVTGDTATLELTPAQAEAVTLAQKVGQLSLTLRSLADAGQAAPDAPEPQAAEPAASPSCATASASRCPADERVPSRPPRLFLPRESPFHDAIRASPGSPPPAFRSIVSRAACAGALMVLAAGPAAALDGIGLRGTGQRGGLAPAPVVNVGPNEADVSRRVDLTMGRSLVIDLPRDAKEVFVANPKVANAVVRSTRKVFIIGIENGATSIFVMDGEGRQIAALDVTVGRDLNVLRQTLAGSVPGGRFDVRPAGDSVLLTGTVGSAQEAQQAIDIANAFVGVGGAGGGARGAVINNLTIRGKDQVMLRVTVVEVSRQVLKQFGINLNANWSNMNFVNTLPFPLTGGAFPPNNVLQAR